MLDKNICHLTKLGDGVYQSNELIIKLSGADISFLKQEAQITEKKRARICAHRSNNDSLHEMIIVLTRDSYIHPHRHIGKSESFHIVEGEVDIIVFKDSGEVEEVVNLAEPGKGKNFYYRLNDSRFHTLIIKTEFLVVHEVTNGPFSKGMTEFADFAPQENNHEEVENYINSLIKKIY